MAGIIKEEMEIENIEIKEEIPEDILPSPSEAETSAVYIKKEDVKVENTETIGKIKNQNI